MATISSISMRMTPVKIKMQIMTDVCSGLANAIYILSEIDIRGVSVKRKIGMSIGITLALNQMAFYSIDRNGRRQ